MYLQHAYKGRNEWWRYILTTIIVVSMYFIAQVPLVILIVYKAMANGDTANIKNYISPDMLGISQNAYFLLLVAPLILVLVTLVFCIKTLHWHTLTGVFTSYSKFRWKNYFGAAFIWFMLSALLDILSYGLNKETYAFHFHAKEFIILVVISLVFVPFQSAWEELYFRGNLLQGFGLLFKNRLPALLITSTLFGLVHSTNPEVEKFGFAAAMIQYIGFGLFLGILVIMDGGLEMALGIHAINNIYSLTLVSYEGTVIETPALITKTDNDITFSIVLFILAAFIALILLSKLYKWQSFKWLFSNVNR